jgi:hypothetical protein
MRARAFRKNACDNTPSRWRVTNVFAIFCALVLSPRGERDASRRLKLYSKPCTGTLAGAGGGAGSSVCTLATCEPAAALPVAGATVPERGARRA